MKKKGSVHDTYYFEARRHEKRQLIDTQKKIFTNVRPTRTDTHRHQRQYTILHGLTETHSEDPVAPLHRHRLDVLDRERPRSLRSSKRVSVPDLATKASRASNWELLGLKVIMGGRREIMH